MTFEHELRRSLHRNASELDLTGGGVDVVVSRARQRRHRRNAAMGTVGTVALLAGALTVVSTRDDGSPSVAVGTPGLPTAGPLQLEWSSSEGGVIGAMSSAAAPDGTIYALSTEPGSTYDTSDFRADTLYRLDPDGSWSARSAEQTGVDLVDLAVGSSLLYGISTEPMAEGAGYGVTLSTSADEGESWDTTDLPAVEPPSDAVPWRAFTGMKVAAAGSTVVAVVTTSHWVSPQDLPGAAQIPDDELVTTIGVDGIVLGRIDRTTSPVTSPDGRGAPTEEIPVATFTWSDLGVTGYDDLQRTDVYVDSGDGWERTDATLEGLDVVDGLAAADGTFVLSGQGAELPDTTSRPFTFVSDDGVSWTRVQSPVEYRPVLGFGSSFVVVDDDGTSVQVSTDRGASWQSVRVPGEDVTGGDPFRVGTLTAGPLGLVATVTDADGGRLRGVLVTRDLQSWTSYDLDGVGASSQGFPQVLVGTDRIVVTITLPGADQANEPSRSRTFVGVPTRAEASTTTTSVVVDVPAGGQDPGATTTTGGAPTTTALMPATSTTTEPALATTTTTAAVAASTTP